MFPDFLCIGAQKAGTSWLYHALAAHPEIRTLPVKEFHYFDLPTAAPTAVLTAHRKRFRLHWSKMRAAAARGDEKEAQWLRRYLFAPRTDRWYGALFRDENDSRLVGDITPSYARLHDTRVAHMAQLMPRTRALLLLRNPLERLWSQAKMDLGRRGKLDTLSDEAVLRYLASAHPVANTDYPAILRTWERHWGEERFWVGFMDQIGEDPRAFLREVYIFLGLSRTDGPFPDDAGERRNSTPDTPIPPAIERRLAEHTHPIAQAMQQRFQNDYTARWVSDIEKALAR